MRTIDPGTRDVEIDTLAGLIAQEVADRVATVIVHAEDWLEGEQALTELQRIMLVRAALLSLSNLEEVIAARVEAAVGSGPSGSDLRLVSKVPVRAEKLG